MPGRIRLRVDRRTIAQISGPMMGHNSQGLTVVESKDAMRKRGLRSPDRAEAWLLSIYEPGPARHAKRRPRVLA
jgi:hypothetical protein